MPRATRLSNIRHTHLAVIPAFAVLALVATSAHPASAQTPLTASFTARAVVIHNRCGFIGTFNASASVAPAGAPITQYAWNFGDGTSAVTTSPETGESYSAGSYIAVLTVTDADGATASTSRAISGGSGSLKCS
ncbi:MAG: PKD domain-containing protein [Solirubrobacteraceae bacterium]